MCDHLHSVRDIAIYDSAQDTTTISKHRVFDAFGRLIADTGSSIPHLFYYTARPLDPSTSLQNNLNRWYDAAVGIWASEDRIIDDIDLLPIFTNPMTRTDPSGLAGADIKYIDYLVKKYGLSEAGRTALHQALQDLKGAGGLAPEFWRKQKRQRSLLLEVSFSKAEESY